jgi:hypothetical protein
MGRQKTPVTAGGQTQAVNPERSTASHLIANPTPPGTGFQLEQQEAMRNLTVATLPPKGGSLTVRKMEEVRFEIASPPERLTLEDREAWIDASGWPGEASAILQSLHALGADAPSLSLRTRVVEFVARTAGITLFIRKNALGVIPDALEAVARQYHSLIVDPATWWPKTFIVTLGEAYTQVNGLLHGIKARVSTGKRGKSLHDGPSENSEGPRELKGRALQRFRKHERFAKAVALVQERPWRLLKDIAACVGCAPSTLSKDPNFRAAVRAARAPRKSMPKGAYDKRTGGLDASADGDE